MSDDGPSPGSGTPSQPSRDRLLTRLRSVDRTLAAVLAVTALSLAVRLYGLGSRIAQWDEGRVAYWVLRYQETGAWEYRPIVHGPFLFHVDKWMFTLLGANDFTMRLVVALVGGLLPLSAWLFREHLRRDELIALALVFAANPLLIYYSRFFRNDVLLASFMVFSLGLFVRAYDTRAPKYVYGGAILLALGFTTKENALIYPLCWLGAGALLLDHRLLRISERARRATASARDRAQAMTDGGRDDDETSDDGLEEGTANDESADETDDAVQSEDASADEDAEVADADRADAEVADADRADAEDDGAEAGDAAASEDEAEAASEDEAEAASEDDARDSADDGAGDPDAVADQPAEPSDGHGRDQNADPAVTDEQLDDPAPLSDRSDADDYDPAVPTDGHRGRADPLDYVADLLGPAAGRLSLPAAAVVVVLNPYLLAALGDVLTRLLALVAGSSIGRVGFVALAPVGLAGGGLALVTALDRPESPQAYAGVVVSYATAVGLWAFGAGPDVTTVAYVLVFGLWLALLADVALFDADAPLSGTVPVSYALFFAIVVFFYAPRAGDTGGIGLYAAFSAPETAPAVVHEAVLGSWYEFLDTWGASSHQEHPYVPFFVDYLERLRAVALVTVLAAVAGFVHDRYGAGGPRDLVALGAYWGGASVLGYPLITDIMSPWSVVHSVVPLAFPAAVGLATVVRWARGVDVDHPVRTTVAVVLVVALVGWTAGTAYDANVAAPDERRNEAFVHWTQPENELRYTLQTVGRVSAEHDDGYDVLFYGSRRGGSESLFYVPNERLNDRPPAAGGWYDRLPLPWYLERYDANVTSSPITGDPAKKLADPPPVVVAYAWDSGRVRPHMGGYVLFRHEFKLYDEEILVFVDADYLDGYGTTNGTGTVSSTTGDWGTN